MGEIISEGAGRGWGGHGGAVRSPPTTPPVPAEGHWGTVLRGGGVTRTGRRRGGEGACVLRGGPPDPAARHLPEGRRGRGRGGGRSRSGAGPGAEPAPERSGAERSAAPPLAATAPRHVRRGGAGGGGAAEGGGLAPAPGTGTGNGHRERHHSSAAPPTPPRSIPAGPPQPRVLPAVPSTHRTPPAIPAGAPNGHLPLCHPPSSTAPQGTHTPPRVPGYPHPSPPTPPTPLSLRPHTAPSPRPNPPQHPPPPPTGHTGDTPASGRGWHLAGGWCSPPGGARG